MRMLICRSMTHLLDSLTRRNCETDSHSALPVLGDLACLSASTARSSEQHRQYLVFSPRTAVQLQPHLRRFRSPTLAAPTIARCTLRFARCALHVAFCALHVALCALHWAACNAPIFGLPARSCATCPPLICVSEKNYPLIARSHDSQRFTKRCCVVA